ncbi:MULTISPECIES: hypothetical protein [unclassified Minwuia]|jgi:hypothetical protein|uniref:hypothetical protein n=1 Tax=unclassified Minwuia TaxID=2618799 RepID=UPI00247A814F|nr:MULTISPECIES: hypothetical protein [unclassified Minwuia]
MSLEKELRPYIDALVDRKHPLGTIELRGFVNKLSSIAVDYSKRGGKSKTDSAQAELSADDRSYLERQINLSLEKLASSADAILEAVDSLSDAAGDRKKTQAASSKIVQAFDFQDLVGQRLLEMRRRLSEPDQWPPCCPGGFRSRPGHDGGSGNGRQADGRLIRSRGLIWSDGQMLAIQRPRWQGRQSL